MHVLPTLPSLSGIKGNIWAKKGDSQAYSTFGGAAYEAAALPFAVYVMWTKISGALSGA
jgi:hypothetical protein